MPNQMPINTQAVVDRDMQLGNNINNAYMQTTQPDYANSMGQYDPNQMDINKANELINKQYADYVTSPVSPALNAMANTQFNPQSAGLVDLAQAGGKTGQSGAGSMQSALQGIVQGAQAGLSGGTGGATGTGAASAAAGVTQGLDFAKYKNTLEQQKTAIMKDVVTGIKADTGIQDEITRGQAINEVNNILNNSNTLNNRTAGKALMLKMMEIIRPQIRRLPGQEMPSFSNIQGFMGQFLNAGLNHRNEIINKWAKGEGILDEDEINEYKDMINNIQESSKINYSNAVKPYMELMQRAGYTPAESQKVISTQEGYNINYVPPTPEEKKAKEVYVTPPKADDKSDMEKTIQNLTEDKDGNVIVNGKKFNKKTQKLVTK